MNPSQIRKYSGKAVLVVGLSLTKCGMAGNLKYSGNSHSVLAIFHTGTKIVSVLGDQYILVPEVFVLVPSTSNERY